MAYSLGAGYNAAVLTVIATITVTGQRLAYITSLGTFQASREFIGLDQITQDDGDDTFTWTFEYMRPEETSYIKTTFLAGARSGRVTVETLNNNRVWVQENAILTLPPIYPLRGKYYGPVIFTFRGGVLLP